MVGPFVLDVRFIFDFPVGGGAPAVLNLICHISSSQFRGGVKRFNRWGAEGIFLPRNLGVHKAWPDVEALREFQFWVSHPELIEGSLIENRKICIASSIRILLQEGLSICAVPRLEFVGEF